MRAHRPREEVSFAVHYLSVKFNADQVGTVVIITAFDQALFAFAVMGRNGKERESLVCAVL